MSESSQSDSEQLHPEQPDVQQPDAQQPQCTTTLGCYVRPSLSNPLMLFDVIVVEQLPDGRLVETKIADAVPAFDLHVHADNGLGLDLSMMCKELRGMLREQGLEDSSQYQICKRTLRRTDTDIPGGYVLRTQYNHTKPGTCIVHHIGSLTEAHTFFDSQDEMTDQLSITTEELAELEQVKAKHNEDSELRLTQIKGFINDTQVTTQDLPEDAVDDDYFEYQSRVVDAVTKGPITDETTVVILTGGSSRGAEGIRLGNHSRGTQPSLKTQIAITDAAGTSYALPSYKDGGEENLRSIVHGASLQLQWLELDVDPQVRIRFRCADSRAQKTVCSASFNIPYKSPSGHNLITRDRMDITREGDTFHFDFQFTAEKVLAGGGVKPMGEFVKRFSSEDRHLFATLCQLRKSKAPVRLHLKMSYQMPAPKVGDQEAAKELPANLRYVLERVPNTTYSVPQKLLKSFTTRPYDAFFTDGQIVVQAGSMRKFGPISTSHAKIPFTNMYTSNVFTSIQAARAKLAFAVDAEYQTEKHQLKLLENARHKIILFSFGGIVVAFVEFGSHKTLGRSDDESIHLRIDAGSKVTLAWSTGQSEENETHQQAHGRVIIPVAGMPKADIAVLLDDRDAKSLGARPANVDQHGRMGNASWGQCVPAQVIQECSVERRENVLRGRYHSATVTIEANKPQYSIRMATVNRLTSAKAAEFHQYVLNQQPFLRKPKPSNTLMDGIDFVSPKEKEAYMKLVDREWDRLMKWQPKGDLRFEWNSEQMAFFHNILEAPSRMLFVTGCAGTGKSYMLIALGAFFWNLNFCVISLGTSNSNVDDHVLRMDQQYGDNIPILRLMPHSGEHGPQETAFTGKISATDPNEVSQGDYFEVHKFEYLESLRELPKTRFDATRDKLLPLRVSKYAEDGSMSWEITHGQPESDDPHAKPIKFEQEPMHITFETGLPHEHNENNEEKSETTSEISEESEDADRAQHFSAPSHLFKIPVNGDKAEVFSEWKRILRLLKEQPMSEWTKVDGTAHSELKQYAATIYKHCRQHVIAKSRYIATTPQGACSNEVNHFFACDRRDNRTRGFVVLHDEATKGWEVDQWSSFMNGFRTEYGKFRLYVGVGDHSQLQPIVKSPSDVRTNMFRGQLERSCAGRLIEEGLEVIHLTMQGRMHESLTHFVSREIYGGTLVTHKSRTRTLDDELPHIHGPCKQLIIELGKTEDRLGNVISDTHIRRHHFVVKGEVRLNEVTKSKTNLEQLRFGVNHLCPLFTRIFGEKTFDNVLFAVPYIEANHDLVHLVIEARIEANLGKEYFPRIGTIDSLSGAEATVCVVFWIVDKGERAADFGFIKDHGRFNVGSTRGRDLFWTVAGPLDGAAATNKATKILLAKEVQQMRGSNHVTVVEGTDPIIDDLAAAEHLDGSAR